MRLADASIQRPPLHQIRAVTLCSYLDVARIVGLDGRSLLKEAGISPLALEDPESRLPAAAAVELLERSAHMSECDSFGIRMAQSRSYASLGALSVLLERLPTVGDVMTALIQLRRNLSDVLFVECRVRDGMILASFDLVAPYSRAQAADLTVGLGYLAMSSASGGRWVPETVHFTHNTPADRRTFERFFHAPLEFGCDFNGFSFPVDDLKIQLPLANEAMAANVRRLLHTVSLPPADPRVSNHAKHSIMLLLPSGRASVAEVSKNLGMSPRRLQRQLSAEGGSFAGALAEVRRDLAQRFVRGADQSITDIAHSLGYADLSSFTRWFTSEFGAPPSEWRQEQGKPYVEPFNDRDGTPGTARNLPGKEDSLDEVRFFEIYQEIINALPEEIALLDREWNIVVVNESWRKTTTLLGYPVSSPGTNYLEFCKLKSSTGYTPATLVAKGIDEIERGLRKSFRFTYNGRERWEGRTLEVCIKQVGMLGRTYATATRHDTTELIQLRHLREDFSQSLLEGQSEERSRIAREIHDSAMQLLAAMGLTIGQLKMATNPEDTVEVVGEMEQLLGETTRELRAISYLAHPPLLKELGLRNAVQALVDGFARRTGLKIAVQLDATYSNLPPAIEVAMYRIVQEALSNVHRHAQAVEVTVIVTRRKHLIHALIDDDGTGLPADVRLGTGLRSIRSRVAELGGRLSAHNHSPHGTRLIASLRLTG